MKGLVALLLVLVLLSCGGGGGGGASSAVPPFTGAPRTDLLFGYFSQDAATALETLPHTNLLSTTGGMPDQAVAAGQANGRKVIAPMSLCLLPLAQGEANARWWFQQLHDAGVLGSVVAVSWCDEPNTARAGGWSDADATAMNAAVRRAMAGFPELHAAIKIVYHCDGNYPGLSTADWAGCDDYDSGCTALSRWYPGMKAAMRPEQRLTLHPGGSTKPGGGWRQDPTCFVDYAEADPQVAAIEVFAWQTLVDGATYVGVRDNGMRAAYCAAGARVAGAATPCP